MIQGLVLTPMRARVALDKNVFLVSLFGFQASASRAWCSGWLPTQDASRLPRSCSGMIRFCRIAVLREVEEMIRFDGSLNLFHFYVDTFSITSILMLSKEKPYKQAKMLKYQRLITTKYV